MGETVFFRLLDSEDKAVALANEISRTVQNALLDNKEAGSARTFSVAPSSFRQIPGTPFAYWASSDALCAFTSLPLVEGGGRMVKQGLATTNDFRFIRAWWEISPFGMRPNGRWFPFAKGGVYSPFYSDILLVVDWLREGAQSWAIYQAEHKRVGGIIKNPSFYGRPGLTWSRRTQSGLALRIMPQGCIFADKGPAVFVDGDRPELLLELLSVTNSTSFRRLVDLQMAFGSFEVGVIQRTPVPHLDIDARVHLTNLAKDAWKLKRSVDASVETSHAFTHPALLLAAGAMLHERLSAWESIKSQVEDRLQSIQSQIDAQVSRHYGISEDSLAVGNIVADAGHEGKADEEQEDIAILLDAEHHVAALLSYSVGACFGRWDIRRDNADGRPQPEPFDALPVCSPGMLQGDDGFPLTQVPADYPLSIATSGLLVDDPGHPSDVSTASKRVFDVLFPQDTEARWVEAGKLLRGAKGKPEEWLRKEFFSFHVQQYSRSRRKAPIYWQLAIQSVRYSVWLYLPRFTRDTLFNVLEVVKLKLLHEERQLEALRKDSGAQRRALDLQEDFVEELRTFRDEVARVAPLWNPNLDDGVLINFALLWRLVPQHRAWQKECKTCWDELTAGEYDWAHLAMHLWPERVVPKCRKDRSLAIAHGLENVFWFEDEDGKWKPRPEPTRSIESLVEERTSPAVKTARDNLLSAAAPVGTGRRASAARARRGSND